MKVGVNLINFGPGATPRSLARTARLAETLGYHLLMVSDHVAITPDVQAEYPAPFYDPFVTLSWLAGATREIGLGTTVAVLPYRHPLQVASMSESVHRLSGGRFILGVGVGWAREEFTALGVPFGKRVLLIVGLGSKDYIRRLSDSIRCLSRTYPRVAGTACPSATCPFVVLVRLDPTEEEPCGTC